MRRSAAAFTLFALLAVAPFGRARAAADLNPSGAVLEITGRDTARPGEDMSGEVRFARVDRRHAVVIRWMDTKGRVCAQLDAAVEPPHATVPYRFTLRRPIGFNHRIEALVDGAAQPSAHAFRVIGPAEPWADYQACVWAHYDASRAATLRAMGFNGTIFADRRTTDADLAFYCDNMAYETFAYYQKRQKEFQAMKKAWAENPDTSTLAHRRPSLTDEDTWAKFRARFTPAVEAARDFRPLFYNVADEMGIGAQSSPTDLDWEYSSRTAWMQWLMARYGTLERLNAEWGTAHRDWQEVRSFFPSTHFAYDQLWRDSLLPAAFGTIDAFNRQFGTSYQSFADVTDGYRAIRSSSAAMTLAGLRGRFRDVADLNARLKNAFASHEAAAAYVEAFERWTAQQNAGDTRGWNLAWWCDFRDYMDDYIARGFARARDIGRELDPDGRFGLTGTHHPGVFNGHEYGRLVNAIDAIIPYDIGQSLELCRGLKPEMPIMHATWNTGNKLRRELWYNLLMGCRGVLFWDNDEPANRLIDLSTGAVTARGEAAGPVLREIASGTGALLAQAPRRHSGIAIYHSMPSVRVAWMHANIGLGRRWIERSSSDEYRSDDPGVLRTSWMKLIEDNHLQHLVVTPAQVAAGRLAQEGVRVLVLPEVWALGDAEAEQVRAFVAAGGCAVADQFLGLYDEHGKRRAAGALDGLFGVDQSGVTGDLRTTGKDYDLPSHPLRIDIGALKAGEAIESAATRSFPNQLRAGAGSQALAGGGGGDALFVRSGSRWQGSGGPTAPGRGETVFLGVDVSHYSRVRMKDAARAEKLVALLRHVLPPDVQPPARVLNAATGARQFGTEVAEWTAGPQRRLVAVWRNYQVRQEGIGGADFADNAPFEKEEVVLVELSAAAFVRNQRTGEDYGKTRTVKATLNPWECLILTVQDAPFEDFTLAAAAAATRGSDLLVSVTGAANVPAGTPQVFHIEAVNPAGETAWHYTRNISTRAGRAEHVIPFALNDPTGAWTMRVSDAATRQTRECRVTVSAPAP